MKLSSKYTDSQLSKSFDFLETFISQNVKSWNTPPDTANIEAAFSVKIKNMSKEDFALLVLHSGYIPEFYLPDSSQETLYSKLIESLVCEWARRIGFKDSFLQTQKSNKEDVTIKIGNKIIVCDAKSFRLGRSQAAPNVKDTIKKQAYTTWLDQYKTEEKVGGLVTFPSLHDWKKGSEAYFYFTEGSPSIMLLFYEHMAFMLMNDISSDFIISFLKSYSALFPRADKNREVYWNAIEKEIFLNYADYKNFMADSTIIIKKKVNHVLAQIAGHLLETKAAIAYEIEQLPIEQVKEIAIEAKYENKCQDIERQQDNIIKFRPHD